MRIRIVAGLVALSVATSVHAEEIMPWIFTGAMPKEATVQGLTTAEIRADGLHIATQEDGLILWGNHPLSGPAEIVTLKVKNEKVTDAALLWKQAGEEGGLLQLYFKIPAIPGVQTVDVDVSGYKQWDWQTEQFAIGFPAGTDLVIEEIQFRHWSWDEQLGLMMKSFWDFDEFRAYSINFLWGPLAARNAVQAATLFDTLPPTAWSALRLMFAVLLAAALIALSVKVLQKNTKRAAGILMGTFIALWMLFDLRMGLEIISYARNDLATYVLKEGPQQTLRTHGNLYYRIQESLPIMKEYGSYVLLEPNSTVIFANVRYLSYPARLVRETESHEGVTLWAIFERRDIRVDEQGRLYKKGATADAKEILSGTGKVLKAFDENNFLFATEQ